MARLAFLSLLVILMFHTSLYGGDQEVRDYRRGSSIAVNGGLLVRDQAHYMSGTPTNVVKGREAQLRLSLDGINQEYRGFSWSLTVGYRLDYKYASGASGSRTGSLVISGEAANSYNQKSLDMAHFAGLSQAQVTITSVSYVNQDASTTLSTLPDDFQLELLLRTERYYELAPSASPMVTRETYNGAKNVLDIAWTYLSGSEHYELEWLYVADGELSGNHLSSNISYDFKNATRVSVRSQHYSIPLSYPKGSIIYRVRGVGYDINAASVTETFVYSGWSYAPSTLTISQANSDDGSDYCLYYHTGLDNDKNWTYTATYAEDGKRKEVASYADGSGRTRQMVTVMNTEDVAIVGESVYDYVGRPMVQILPVPTTNSGVQFYGDSQNPFNGNWDRSNFASDAHLNENNATLPEAMPATAGANVYYSSSNPLSFANKQALPEANGYPYVLTQVPNDGSERVKVSSGLGDTLRYKAQGGHNTRNFYGTPTQAELDRLLGLEAGDASFYQKVLTLDPNGQQSVQYLDAQGRVVATALAGASPSGMTTLPNNTASTITSILFGGSMPSPTDGVILQGQQFLSSSLSAIYVDYDLDPVYLYTCRQGASDSSQPEAYEIPYDLRIEVRNDRGDSVIGYNESAITSLTETPITLANPNIGRYTISRRLEVNQAALDTFLAREAFLMDSTRMDLSSCGPNYLVSGDTICEPLNCDSACIESYSYYYNDTLFYLDTAGTVYRPDAFGLYYAASDPTTTYTNYLSDTGAVSPFADAIKACKAQCADFKDTANAEGIAVAQFLAGDRCAIKWGVMTAQMSPGGEYFDNASGGYTYVDSLGGWQRVDSCYIDTVGYVGEDPILDTICPFAQPNQWLQDSLSFGLDSLNNHFGTGFNSWDSLRNNWQPSYGNYLAGLHPESCAYDFFCNYSFNCGSTTIGMDSLNAYLAQMFLVDSLSNASGQGFHYLNPLAASKTLSTGTVTQDQSGYINYSPGHADPLLCPTASTGTLGRFASDSLTKYLTKFVPIHDNMGIPTGGYYSLWYLLDDPDQIAQNEPSSLDPRLIELFQVFHGGGCATGLIQNEEQKLQFFRQVYLFLHEKVIYDFFKHVYVCPQTGNPYSYWDADTNYDGILDDGSHYSLVYPKNPVYEAYGSGIPHMEAVFKDNMGDLTNHYVGSGSLDSCSRQNFKEYLAANNLVDTTQTPYVYQSSSEIRDSINNQFCLGYRSQEIDSLLKIVDDYNFGSMYLLPDSLRCPSRQQFLSPPSDTCSQQKALLAHQEAERQYQLAKAAYLDSLKGAYLQKAYTDLQGKETVELRYTLGEYHYTLYYYDRADNLIKTVPPKGVNPLTASQAEAVNDYRISTNNPLPVTPLHDYVTNYRYNTQNQLIFQFTPDGDTTKFWYDYANRLVLSQNAVQRDSNEYSYTLYDGLSRIVESGELDQPSATFTDTVPQVSALFKAFLRSGLRKQVTFTLYDQALDQVSPSSTRAQAISDAFGAQGQEFLRNRIASSFYLDDLDTVTRLYIFGKDRLSSLPYAYRNYRSASHYSYDPHGNVNTYVQEIRDLDSLYDHGFFRMDYQYDLVSGNVNQVVYQKGEADEFHHRYRYDADNRIIAVETSRDGMIFSEDARYTYYPHGPLSRMELGADNVQGLDYAYTLQGWLKSVNGASLGEGKEFGVHDLGGDARQGLLNGNHAPDAFGFELSYFEGDYQSIGTNTFSASITAGSLKTGFKSLYNGNIGRMITALNDEVEDPLPVLANLYQYDQLNRLDNFEAYTASGLDQDNATATASQAGYRAEYDYDPNGNITGLRRWGDYTGTGTGIQFDNLTYDYPDPSIGEPHKNQLDHVDDSYPVVLVGDIGDQSAGNYAYDKIGNLIQDAYDTLNLIEWNLQGKIAHIDKGSFDLYFEYDPMGNRLKKHNTSTSQTTYYVRDAQGNVMATYQDDGSDLDLTERMLYGSDRLGVLQEDLEVSASYGSLATLNAEAYAMYSFDTDQDAVSISSSSEDDLYYVASITGLDSVSISSITVLDGSYEVSGSYYVIRPGGYIVFQGSSANLYMDGRYNLSSNATFTLSGNAGSYISAVSYDWTMGDKRYELKNHLGNVLSTVSDLKRWKAVDDIVYTIADESYSSLDQTETLGSNSNEWTVVAGGSYSFYDMGTSYSFEGRSGDYLRRMVAPETSGDCNYKYCLDLEFEGGEVEVIITLASSSAQVLTQTITESGNYCFK